MLKLRKSKSNIKWFVGYEYSITICLVMKVIKFCLHIGVFNEMVFAKDVYFLEWDYIFPIILNYMKSV
jgi:hypothetical protein